MTEQSFTLFTPDEIEEETEEETEGSSAETAADGQDDTGSEIDETETSEGLQTQKRWTASESEFNRVNEEVPAPELPSSSSGTTAIAIILFIIGLLLLFYGWVL